MSFSGFKKGAKNKLDDYHPEIDAEALWAQLEPQFPKKEKKKRFFLWLFLGALIVGAGTFAWWHAFKNSDTNKPAQVTNIAQTPDKKELKNEVAIIAEDDPTINLIPAKKQTTKPPSTSIQQNTPIISKPTDTKINTLPKGATKNITSTITTLADNYKQDFSPSGQTNKAVVTDLQIENANLSIEKQRVSFSTFEGLASIKIDFPLSAPMAYLSLVLPEEEFEDQIIFRSSKNKFQWLLGLRVGGGQLNQDLTLQDTEEGTYFDTRLDTEKTLEEFYTALEVQVRHRSGLYFQTGLEYSRMATRFYQESQIAKAKTIPNGIQRIYTNSTTGDTTFIYGPIPKYEMSVSAKKRYNNFHSFQIPLLAGYRLEQEAWFFGLETGVLVNASLKKSGNIDGKENTLYDLAIDDRSWFKNKLSLRPMVAIHAGYRIRPVWEIYLSPQYRFPVKMNTPTNPVEEQFSSLGLSAGIRFRL